MEIMLMKSGHVLVPYDRAATDFIARMKTGELTRAEYKRVRNYAFHKKYFALVTFAFDQWEPKDGLQYQGQPVTKNLNRFRKDLVILAGYFDSFVNLKGEVRLEAKSISFAAMEEIEFESLYNATINVILVRILTNYTREDIDKVVAQLINF